MGDLIVKLSGNKGVSLYNRDTANFLLTIRPREWDHPYGCMSKMVFFSEMGVSSLQKVCDLRELDGAKMFEMLVWNMKRPRRETLYRLLFEEINR